MTKTNLKANHIRIENLYKSMFSEVKHTSINIRDDKVEIIHLNEQNQDPAIIELSETKIGYVISYWDGYSLSENDLKDMQKKWLKILKGFVTIINLFY